MSVYDVDVECEAIESPEDRAERFEEYEVKQGDWLLHNGIRVGSKVRVRKSYDTPDLEWADGVWWTPEMDSFIGEEWQVFDISNEGLLLGNENESYYFPYDVLTPVREVVRPNAFGSCVVWNADSMESERTFYLGRTKDGKYLTLDGRKWDFLKEDAPRESDPPFFQLLRAFLTTAKKEWKDEPEKFFSVINPDMMEVLVIKIDLLQHWLRRSEEEIENLEGIISGGIKL